MGVYSGVAVALCILAASPVRPDDSLGNILLVLELTVTFYISFGLLEKEK